MQGISGRGPQLGGSVGPGSVIRGEELAGTWEERSHERWDSGATQLDINEA